MECFWSGYPGMFVNVWNDAELEAKELDLNVMTNMKIYCKYQQNEIFDNVLPKIEIEFRQKISFKLKKKCLFSEVQNENYNFQALNFVFSVLIQSN